MKRLRRRIRSSAGGLLVIAAVVGAAQFGGVGGQAAAPATTWAAAAHGCGTSETSGQADDTGATWVPCDTGMARIALDGSVTKHTITTFTSPRRIAPSPDGKLLYISANGAKDGLISSAIVRLKPGAAANTWERDATFVPETYTYAGKQYAPCANYLATDALGDVYATTSRGCTAGSPAVVVKYGPDGKLRAVFGADETTPKQPGAFKTMMGITASRDGQRVVVTDQGNSRLHEFRYVRASRSYTWHRTLETASATLDCTNPPATGAKWQVAYADGRKVASTSGLIAGERRYLCSPYDARFDAWGRLFVADTTHRRVLMFDEELQPLATVIDRYTGTPTATTSRPHALTVMGDGGVIVRLWNQIFTPSAGGTPSFTAARSPVTALPLPDTTAPKLTKLTGPVESEAPVVKLTLTASDEAGGTGLAKMRLANEDGNFGAWRAYTASLDWTLPATLGPKVVYAQVADAAGNESAIARTSVRRIADTIAPVIGTFTAPATSTTRTVQLTIAATDGGLSGLTSMRLANDGGLYEPWRTFAGSLSWELTGAAGTKVVAVQVRDGAGNVSATSRLKVEFTPPAAPSAPAAPVSPAAPGPAAAAPGTNQSPAASAARGAKPVVGRTTLSRVRATRTVIVRTKVASTSGVRMIRLRNERGAWSAWMPYAAAKRWNLTAGRGAKLVRVQVRDRAGVISAVRTVRIRIA